MRELDFRAGERGLCGGSVSELGKGENTRLHCHQCGGQQYRGLLITRRNWDRWVNGEADELRGYLASSAARFAQGAAQIEWTDVQLVADDPVKGQGLATRDQLMITRLAQIMGQVDELSRNRD